MTLEPGVVEPVRPDARQPSLGESVLVVAVLIGLIALFGI